MSYSSQPIAEKLQIRFSKTGALRFISHHDLMRLFARACRRAGLPVRLTQGFDPRPRIVFATALELGVESRAELVEIELTRWVQADRIKAALDDQLPDGIDVLAVQLLPPRRSGHTLVDSVYSVWPTGGLPVNGISHEKIQALLGRTSLPFDRPRDGRMQQLDLRPSIVEIALRDNEVEIKLRHTERGIARPSEVLALISGKSLMETRRWQTIKTAAQTAP